jgi:hypothetical protein
MDDFLHRLRAIRPKGKAHRTAGEASQQRSIPCPDDRHRPDNELHRISALNRRAVHQLLSHLEPLFVRRILDQG